MRFTDKKILITGASGGIGQVVAAKCQQEGAEVFTTDREGSVSAIGDLTDASFCDALPQLASDAMGGLDIVINNAGVITRGDITTATDDDYALTMAVNVEAPFRICRAAIPLLAATGGGAIVNTASCWGIYPGSAHPLYVMSKAALASLTQCLGKDHAPQNIRVNAVCPNEVNTPMLRSGFAMRGFDPDKAVSELNQTVPLGRIAEPEDIADVILFLASDDARYMCGALVEVNGGKAVI